MASSQSSDNSGLGFRPLSFLGTKNSELYFEPHDFKVS